MNITSARKRIFLFLLSGIAIGFLGLVCASWAQRNSLTRLVMRFGEERTLEDGTKVAITKGDGDLIVVTLSRPTPSSSTVSRSGAGQLQIGTYKGAATTNSTTGTIRITIKSIDTQGNVKAELRASNGLYGEGTLTGTIDATGQLRLQGEIVTTLLTVTRWKYRLTARVEDNALTNGKYAFEDVGTGTEGQGEFYSLKLEKDF